MLRPLRLLMLSGLLVAVALPSVAQGKAAIGISDNKPDMFSDPDFKAMGVKQVRVVISWDILSNKASGVKREAKRFDTWMQGAKADGDTVLIAFNASIAKGKNPKKGQLGKSMKALKKKYPQIKAVSPWNEANLNKTPKQVYAWQQEVKKNCKGCKIVTDVVDKPNLNSWTKKYMKLTKVKIWGLHNYVDVNNLTDKRTKAFLKTTKKGDVWLTETGGVVGRNTTNNSHFAGSGIDFQTKATKYLLDNIVSKQKRIKKVYVYNWDNNLDFKYLSWDSALKDSNKVLRPAYALLKAYK